MARARRKIVLHHPSEVPAAIIDEIVIDMSTRLVGTPESRSCAGLSFGFEITDVDLEPARYDVLPGGEVALTRGRQRESTFRFQATVEVFDDVLLGRSHAFGAILARHVHMQGSLLHIRSLLRMLPAVTRAYSSARADARTRHAERYEFAFD